MSNTDKKVFTPSLAVSSAICFFYVRRRGEIEREIIVKVFGECDENTQNIFQIKFIRIFRSFICCRDEPSSCREYLKELKDDFRREFRVDGADA